MNRPSPVSAIGVIMLLVLLCAPVAPLFAQGELPSRVARLSLIQGEVSLAPAGVDQWVIADLNRPLLGGDRLYAGARARAVLEMDGAALRLDANTALDLLALEEARNQVSLLEGTVNLAVHRLRASEVHEIDTPTLAFVANEPGSYRIDIDPAGGAMVTVFSGSGTVWDSSGRNRRVDRGRSYRFRANGVDFVDIGAIPAGNDFDRFCADLDARQARSESLRYVADNVVGYQDLDRYGTWQTSSDYGYVWFPSGVAVDWAPYRNGRWTWIDPWGWTWVDAAPWGFAPFHYGRWARVHNRWGWIPGPRLRRAVYSPALVAFVGNTAIGIGGAPIGWFPLGPRDIYYPPYRVNQNYFININLGGGRFFQHASMRSHWNDWRRKPDWRAPTYAYRSSPHAVTVVSGERFRDSRLVTRSSERFDTAALQRLQLSSAPSVKPASSAARAASRQATPRREILARPLVTHTPLAARSAGGASVAATPRGAPGSVPPRGARADASAAARITVPRTPASTRQARTEAATSPRGGPTTTPRRIAGSAAATAPGGGLPSRNLPARAPATSVRRPVVSAPRGRPGTQQVTAASVTRAAPMPPRASVPAAQRRSAPAPQRTVTGTRGSASATRAAPITAPAARGGNAPTRTPPAAPPRGAPSARGTAPAATAPARAPAASTPASRPTPSTTRTGTPRRAASSGSAPRGRPVR